MPSTLDAHKSRLLDANNLSLSQLEQAPSSIMIHRVDDGELYFEQSHQESLVLEDGLFPILTIFTFMP